MASVRDWLAAALSSARDSGGLQDENTTDVTLSAKQRVAVERGVEVVRHYGGVLLADAVGFGKTRVATELAKRVVRDIRRRRRSVEAPLFVVPARLRDNWRKAIHAAGWQCGRDAVIVSHHRLSRRPYSSRPPVVVVDEAHRFRNPDAKRSRHLAMVAARSTSILVTATPVCTEREDLLQLLSYFLSDPITKSVVGLDLRAAFAADDAGEFDIVELLEQVVIRRHRPDFGPSGRPAVRFERLSYATADDEAWLWRNLESTLRSLSLRATGEHWPRGLLINHLLRMWESGPDALRQSLDDLCHFHQRWLEAAALGHRVERPQFRSIFSGVDRRQQVFPFLFGRASTEAPDEVRRREVAEDMETLQALIDRVDRARQQTPALMNAILAKVKEQGDERFLIFVRFRAAAEAIYRFLAHRGDLRVGLVTGDSARATGLGETTDRDVLRRFLDARRDSRSRHHRLRILVATDCLAEGVNLQGCAHVILADLPYSPVKLEQRIGRIARPGAAVDRVTVYLPRPDSWTDSLGMRRRLSDRLELADHFGAGLGLAGSVTGPAKSQSGGAAPADAPGPLAAMTRAEQLRNHVLNSVGECTEVPEFASVVDLSGGDPVLWVRVEIDGVITRHIWIAISADSAKPVLRLSEQLPSLARLADDQRPVKRWEPAGEQWEIARRWIRRRRAWIQAAHLAPPLLGAGSEPVRIWRVLRDAADTKDIDVDADILETWRNKLLRAHPPGIRFEMEEMLGEKPTLQKIRHFVDGLPHPGPDRAAQLRVVAVLRA